MSCCDPRVWRGGAGVGRGPGGGGGGASGKNWQHDGVGRKKRAPNTYEISAPRAPVLIYRGRFVGAVPDLAGPTNIFHFIKLLILYFLYHKNTK